MVRHGGEDAPGWRNRVNEEPSRFQQPVISRAVETDPLHPDAVRLWETQRNAGCKRCALAEWSPTVCMFGDGPVPAAGMIVGDFPDENALDIQRPLAGREDRYLRAVLDDAGIDPAGLYVTNAVKCWPPLDARDKRVDAAVKECAVYLEAELARVQPRAVLAMGQAAYWFFMHRKGVVKNRGQAWFHDKYNCWVVPTVHPGYVLTHPNMHAPFEADVTRFERLMSGHTAEPAVDFRFVRSIHALVAMQLQLWATPAAVRTFDLETRGLRDWDPAGRVWCVAITNGDRGPTGGIITWLLPLEHPDAPWSGPELGLAVEATLSLIFGGRTNAHNQKFDLRWAVRLAHRYGVNGTLAELRVRYAPGV